MKKNRILNFYVHNIKISVKSAPKKLENFFEDSLFFFKKRKPTSFNLTLNIRLNELKSLNNLPISFTKIGNNVFIYKNEIVFLDGGLFVQIKKKNNEIFISIFSQKGETYIQRHKKILKNLLFKKDYYFIFRTGLILPIIWILSRKFKIESLHGSAVTSNKNTIIFSGLAGVGKSLITLYLTLEKKFKLISDNYLLYDVKNIYALPEWIRLLEDSGSIFPNIKNYLDRKKFKRNDKNFYKLSENLILNKSKPKFLIFTELSNSNKLIKINHNNSVNRILISKNHVREFPEQNFVGLLDLLLETKNFNFENENVTLKKFIKKNQTYIFYINKKISMSENVKFLMKKLKIKE